MSASVQVTLTDLQVIKAACNAAYFQNQTLDLNEGYRKLNQRTTQSALTKALQGAVGILEQYIVEAEGESDKG